MGLTPKGAIADYEFLLKTGYWDTFSFLVFTRRHWQPMSQQAFYDQMRTRIKFRGNSKPFQLAWELRSTARAWEEYIDQRDMREKTTGA